MNKYIYLKLGGSLITDKSTANTAKTAIIDRISSEIAEFLKQSPETKLIIGHGSGSFGHHAANKYGTFDGVKSKENWQGFFEVWYRARELNNIVCKSFRKAGLNILSFSMSNLAEVSNHQIKNIPLLAIKNTLDNGGIPVVYGDVVFDKHLGGTILSTEDIFEYLSKTFTPERILLAGIENGVYKDFPENNELIPNITPDNYQDLISTIQGSANTDVTGGMAGKVKKMLAIISELPDTNARIFSGIPHNSIKQVLENMASGTKISN